MHRSVEEKLRILKQASSKRKIKKLALQYGISTKTIRNWQKAQEEGKLCKAKKCSGAAKKTYPSGRKKRVLSNFAFRSENVPYPVNGNGKDIYRYLFTDIDRGFIFCAYSAFRDTTISKKAVKKFIELITQGGKCVRNLSTLNDPDQDAFKDLLSGYGAVLTVRRLSEIRKYLKFSLKKESYIYEKAKYENKKEFLTDSLATLCKNNDIIFEKSRCRDRATLALVKKVNTMLHISFLNEDHDCSIEDFLKDVTERLFNKAMEFHKAYNLDNADPYYEKIYFLLNDTGYEAQMLSKIIIQRAKIASLKKEYADGFTLINRALHIIRTKQPEMALELENSAYFLAADICRVKKDKNRAFHYIRKALTVLKKLNEPEKTAVAYINIGLVYSNFGEYKKTEHFFERSKEIIYSNKLKDLYSQIEENMAGLYRTTGRYAEAKIVFDKMIENGHYSDSPFFKALLFGKTGDIYHLTGDIDKSIAYYDSGIEAIKKHEEIRAFEELMLVLRANRAFTLTKMNRYDEAVKEFEENLEKARKGGYTEQVFSNTAHLLMCSTDTGELKTAKNYLRQLGDLLKNAKRPEYEYKYLTGKGDIERLKGRPDKAMLHFTEALRITAGSPSSISSFFDTLLKIAILNIDTKNYEESVMNISELRKKSLKMKFHGYVFKTDILKRKIDCYQKKSEYDYEKYLKRVLQRKDITSEDRYFVQEQIKESKRDVSEQALTKNRS